MSTTTEEATAKEKAFNQFLFECGYMSDPAIEKMREAFNTGWLFRSQS